VCLLLFGPALWRGRGSARVTRLCTRGFCAASSRVGLCRYGALSPNCSFFLPFLSRPRRRPANPIPQPRIHSCPPLPQEAPLCCALSQGQSRCASLSCLVKRCFFFFWSLGVFAVCHVLALISGRSQKEICVGGERARRVGVDAAVISFCAAGRTPSIFRFGAFVMPQRHFFVPSSSIGMCPSRTERYPRCDECAPSLAVPSGRYVCASRRIGSLHVEAALPSFCPASTTTLVLYTTISSS
jgi:hypothetical protein